MMVGAISVPLALPGMSNRNTQAFSVGAFFVGASAFIGGMTLAAVATGIGCALPNEDQLVKVVEGKHAAAQAAVSPAP